MDRPLLERDRELRALGAAVREATSGRSSVRNRPEDAADTLLGLLPQVHRLGGSDAQRDVVEATLLHALAVAGRLEPARSLIQRQLDRPVAPAAPTREEHAP